MFNKKLIKTIHRTFASTFLLASLLSVNAQAELSGPVNYIIPFGPGGESDISARFQQPFFKSMFGLGLKEPQRRPLSREVLRRLYRRCT